MDFIRRSKEMILDLTCIICGGRELSDEISFICRKCHEAFDEVHKNICGVCGHPLKGNVVCPSCINLGEIHFDSFRYLQLYTGNFKHIIRMWKMDDNFMINRLFIMLLVQKRILDKCVPVTVVPDDPFKRFKKGRCGLTYLLKGLKKKGYAVHNGIIKKKMSFAGPQKMKSGMQRRNLENKFYLEKNDMGRYSGEIYLIDDIYTTGSTMNRCSALLKLAGFEKVHAVSFFRASLFDRE